MERIKDALKSVGAQLAGAAKALVAGAVVAATPIVLDAVTELSLSEDRLVAAFAALALVYLVPNRKAVE
jgi:hypothetical protein